MNETKRRYDSEIDLMEIFTVLWKRKFLIIGFVLLSVITVYFYQETQPRSFNAITKISTITPLQADRYRTSNSYEILPINPEYLLDLYIDILKEGSVFEQAIDQYELINKENYENEKNYREDIIALSSSIKVFKESYDNENNSPNDWQISFIYTDKEKWKRTLSLAHNLANESIKNILINRFEKITDVFIVNQNNKINAINAQIQNALTDYETTVATRIEFLREQAIIARKLEIAKSALPPKTTEWTQPNTQQFTAESGIVTNVQISTPFYYRGYIAIEAEVELLESRSDKELYVNNLLKLRQNKRKLEQDILVELAKSSFISTPVYDEQFKAATIKAASTKYIYISSRLLPLLITFVVSGLVIVIYTLLLNALRLRL